MLNARVVGEVRRGDGAALARGETDDAGAAREDRSGPQRLLPLAHERERRQIAGLGNEPVERGLSSAQQGPDAFHHAPRDGPEVERFAAQAAQLRQGLGRAAAPLTLRQEAGVANRRPRLRDQGFEDLVLLALEVEGLLAHEHEDTDHGVLVDDRQGVQVPEAVSGIPLARDHGRSAEVVGLDGLVVERHPSGDALTVAEARAGVPRADRRVGACAQLDRAAGLVGDPERHAARVGEPDRRGRDLAEDLVGIERRGDELDELDQRVQLARQRLGGVDAGAALRSPLAARAVHYPKLRRRLRAARTRRRESCPSRPDRSARPAVQTTVRSSRATPSGTIVAGTRGRALELFASHVGTSHVGNGMSSPPAGEGFGTGGGDPTKPIVSARQISSPPRTQAYCPERVTSARSRRRRR